ncbi:MAG TPA: sirohydrochlorin cobaltochelatase [Humidesulfovibrio sp.]|uniref:sirohydrochlorin cobaltochelatase n=1 Tax=Humidesulfovibrio sp. TaxID=2910988 RepID=UPI002BDF5852|nr:sirohydrochlorin cobaltochelatase [Humidesulfovibrio sp.]HWR02555.1 sirohydrochlorin cobaltochelatase [Humidesulfovibrio sp.]
MPDTQNAILLAAFGSRLPGAEASLDAIRARAAELYPDWRVETALTSGTVRRHKGAHTSQGQSPEDILKGLQRQGVKRLAVQSLHVIPGDEYKSLERLVAGLSASQAGPQGFEGISLGRPLLGNAADVRLVAQTLLTVLPPARKPGEAVLLMGHGTRGRANGVYQDLADELRALDPLVLIGALEAEPGLAAKVDELRSLGASTVHLMPLLFARGVHATRDMAGEGKNSWRAGLTNAGFACETHVKGAGEQPALADIWLAHLREAVERLSA